MFKNSQNVHINGGQYYNSTTNIESGSLGGLEVLRKYTVFGASYDSGERFEPPNCAPGTRTAIIRKLMDWVTSKDNSPSMLWLRGSAGVGKSALAQYLADQCSRGGILASSFFFSRTSDNRDRSNGRMLFPTIACQLTSSFPATRTLIKKVVAKDPSVLGETLKSQMQKLIIDPLNTATGSPIRRYLRSLSRAPVRLIVIDGLDECSDPDIQCEIIRVIGAALPQIRSPIRIFIASRPESHIIRTFKHDLQHAPLIQIDLSEDSLVDLDIHTFLTSEFNEIKRTHPLSLHIPASWPTQERVDELVCRSSGQFIYASTVIKYIKSTKHRPTDRLDIILGLSPTPTNDNPFAQLDALYLHILSSVGDVDSVFEILSLLVVPRTTEDGFGDYSTPAKIEKFLGLKLGDVELLLSDLRSVLTVTPDKPIRLLHTSLTDFLLDPSRAGKFHIDLGMAHSILARGYMSYVLECEHGLKKSNWLTIIAHLENAVLTEDLYKDLQQFDFLAILCPTSSATERLEVFGRSLARFRWQQENYDWFWIYSFLHCIREKKNLRDAREIFNPFIECFDEHLKTKLANYFTYKELADSVAMVTLYNDRDQTIQWCIYKCILGFLDSKNDSSRRALIQDIDRTGLSLQELGHVVTNTHDGWRNVKPYLQLLVGFLLNPRRSGRYFIDSGRYAGAVLRCQQCINEKRYQKIDIWSESETAYHNLTHVAFLRCSIALLPKAGITEDLVSLLSKDSFDSQLEDHYIDFQASFAREVQAYINRANLFLEPEILSRYHMPS